MEKMMLKQSFCWSGAIISHGETSSKKKIIQFIKDLEIAGCY